MDFLPFLEKNEVIYTHCYDYSHQQWLHLLNSWNEPKYRVKQILQGLYKNLWFISLNTNKYWTNLPITLREKLIQNFAINKLQCIKLIGSIDKNTIKASFVLEDNNFIESVLIKSSRENDKIPIYTLCISSQSGCPLNCDFALQGKWGLNEICLAER
jgi:23S rRNA (adenine2503-C2)-methyltransferase